MASWPRMRTSPNRSDAKPNLPRTRAAETTLRELRTAQDRLVQTEKLASLRSTDRWHRARDQDPLNFVNNFSAISVELIDELREALAGAISTTAAGEVSELRTCCRAIDKVAVLHGKRADAIVKDMLLHRVQACGAPTRRCQRGRRGEPHLRLSWGTGREARAQYDLEKVVGPAAARSICSRRRSRGCCSI